ncbi:MAG TPA: AAA family ATPase [Desulfitobacterium dehalogenans]|uniref:Nuclease SbcCD subunit C n=1 Tax=Desulfitobacterium dehalogenans TaxID=36854 RepID=A0A7C7D644_9FIRM|nr:AAA family ATPase [Desulfitobacterium dehalogenans]
MIQNHIKPGRVLKALRLQNFQSHGNTHIEFAGQGCLTVITGPSDSGKSAIIRALKWLLYNSPRGDGFITVGKDICGVRAVYDDETVVARYRSRGSVNRYEVNSQAYEGFGTGVPLEIQQATGIRKLHIGDQDYLLNLSDQLAGPFLGNDSTPAPARAKVLGKLAGTEEMDHAGKEVGTDLFRAKREREGLEHYIDSTKDALEGYDWIPVREAQLIELDRLIKAVKKDQEKIARLKELHEQFVKLAEAVLGVKAEIDRLRPVAEGLAYVRCIELDSAEHGSLNLMNQSYIEAWSKISDANVIIHRLVNLDTAMAVVSATQDGLTLGTTLNAAKGEYLYAVGLKAGTQSRLKALAQNYESAMPYLLVAETEAVNVDSLDWLLSNYEYAYQGALALRRKVQSTARIEDAWEFIAVLPEKSEKVKLLRADLANIGSLSRVTLNYAEQAELAKKDAECLEAEYIQLMRELGKCPTCGGEICIEKLKEVI